MEKRDEPKNMTNNKKWEETRRKGKKQEKKQEEMGRNRGKPEEAGSKSKKRETTGKKLQEKGRKKIYIYCWCLFFKNSDLTRKLDQLSSFTSTFRVKYI